MTQELETRVKDLEAEVQALSDRGAIRNLRCFYHECINYGMKGDKF